MRPRHKLRAVPFLAMLAVIALAGGCANAGDPSPSALPLSQAPRPREGGRIVVGTTAESDGFLPAINRWTPPSYLIARTVYDPLASVDDSGAVRPYLAESFSHNDDYTQWTIKLRPNISFHDHTPLTTEALVKHFAAAQASLIAKDSIAAFGKLSSPDPLTLVINLKQQWAHLPVLLASQLGFIPAPSMYDPENEGAASNPIGTGPFKFIRWDQNSRLVVDRNTEYWRKDRDGKQLPYLSQIEFRPVNDDNLRSVQLRNGDLDVIQTESYTEVSAFQKSMREEPNSRTRALLDNSQGAESGIALNTQNGPFTDRNLRLAAAYAIDRQGLIDQLYNGFYDIANGPFTAKSKWGDAAGFPTYFPERARQLVNEWKAASKTKSAPLITITNIAVADSVQLAQRVAKAWTDVGFEVQLRNEEEKVGSVDLVTGKADATMLRFWDRADPDGLYHYFISDHIAPHGEISLNFSRYGSPTVDAALKAGRASDDDAVRRQQYQKVWDDFAQNLPILFLFHTRWALGYQSKVHGLGELILPDGNRAEPVTWGNAYLTGVWIE